MLTGTLVFLFLLVALLAIPITLTFHVNSERVSEDKFSVLWAFGLVQLRFPSARSEKSPLESKEPEQHVDPTRSSSHNGVSFFAAIRQASIRRRVIKFIRDMWRAVQKKNVSIRVRLGLGDPADTGQLWAVLGPVAGILADIQDASIHLEPEFFETVIELESSGSIRFTPLRIAYVAIALLLSPQIWKGMRQMQLAGR